MIISHAHQYIFVKTEKTAGTSVEIALSKYCGPDDIITPIIPKDEALRVQLGYRGAQNYLIPFSKYEREDWARLFLRGRRLAFFNHCSASFIRKYIGEEIWNSYYKFSIERNPWDKVVSWYYWDDRLVPKPPISEFIRCGRANQIRGFDLYTINSQLAVDRVCLYERLNEELLEVARNIGLPGPLELPRAKAGHRPDKKSYREVLSEPDRFDIARSFAREIALFGYTWDGDVPTARINSRSEALKVV